MFKYSFIIPHKNCPSLLQRCVDSIPIRNDIQIIVIDDNSDEDKKPLIERKGVEIVLLDAKNSKGAGRARNVGLEKAKGKWLLFADADDYYVDDFLSKLDKYVNSNFDVIYFNFVHKDGTTGQELPSPNIKKYFNEYDGGKVSQDQIRFHHKFPWTKMVMRSFVNKYRIHFEETPNGNDIFFSMSVGYFAKNIMVEKDVLYVYLKNENSLVNSKNKPVSSHICKIIHNIQLNSFYSFVGHPEWKTRVANIILRHINEYGITIIFPLLLHCPVIWKKRMDWIEYFQNTEKPIIRNQ